MAKVVLDQSRGARERAGLEEAKGTMARETERAIGLVLPLSGKGRALGERALRGALLAADLAGGALPSGLPIELRVRDSGSDPTRAQGAVDELLEERVAAVLGSPDRAESGQAAARAEALAVPYLALAPDDVRRGELVFKMVRARAQAARVLVARAQKGGARRLAVLAPDSAFGRSFAQAIVDAARAANAKVVADLRFPEAATTFVDQAKRISSAGADARASGGVPRECMAAIRSPRIPSRVTPRPPATGSPAAPRRSSPCASRRTSGPVRPMPRSTSAPTTAAC
jgi:ABC-type branched-subunit amino acid transport system substrate-binding protein